MPIQFAYLWHTPLSHVYDLGKIPPLGANCAIAKSNRNSTGCVKIFALHKNRIFLGKIHKFTRDIMCSACMKWLWKRVKCFFELKIVGFPWKRKIMNRLFLLLLLAAILVEKGEWKFGLEDFGLWVVLPPIAPKYGDCTHVLVLFTNNPFCLYVRNVCICRGSHTFCCIGSCFDFRAADLLFRMEWVGTHVCAWPTIVDLFFFRSHGICYVILIAWCYFWNLKRFSPLGMLCEK